jgi:hypothetical protein
MAADVPAGWNAVGDEFFFIEFVPPGKGGTDIRFDIPFESFLVSVDSQSELGRLWHNDPLSVLRRADDDLRARGENAVFRAPPEGEQVQVLSFRVNAELPANPRLHMASVSRFSGSAIFVIVHYKDLGFRNR